MDVRNCKTCGRLFNYMGGAPLCPECKAALEKKFEDVKVYVVPDVEGAVVADQILPPSAPVAPVSPFGPCGPVEPVAPVSPLGPVAPVSPFGPCGPVAPVAPVSPFSP